MTAWKPIPSLPGVQRTSRAGHHPRRPGATAAPQVQEPSAGPAARREGPGMTVYPPVTRLGTAVLLQSTAVGDVAYLVRVGMRGLAARDGVAALPRWRALLLELERASSDTTSAIASARRSEDFRTDDDQPEWDPEVLISTKEAAAMLNLTPRQVTNLAGRLGARRTGRAYVFDRGIVEAEARHRHQIGTD